jgi:hypothetical protein
LKGAGVIIGGTLLSVLVATWLRRQGIDRTYWTVLLNSGWLVSFVVSQHYSTLKGWPARAQAIFIGGLSTVIVLISLGGIWISGR